MGQVGHLGEVIFEASEKTVLALDNMQWSGSARYATHQRHGGNALTEFTGLDPDKISFDLTLLAQLGVNPMEELVKLWTYLRNGTPVGLAIGNHGYGRYRWTLTSIKIKIQDRDLDGDIIYAVVSVDLQEYLRN